MASKSTVSRILFTAGNIAMLAGAIDPLEGSIAILAGCGLLLLGTCFRHGERKFLVYRARGFAPVLVGVSALWVLSLLGGFGGDSGLSAGWGIPVLLYPVGWLANLWAPDSPRWVLWLGAAVGLWYLSLPIVLINLKRNVQFEDPAAPEVIMSVFGILVIGGCIYFLRRRKQA